MKILGWACVCIMVLICLGLVMAIYALNAMKGCVRAVRFTAACSR